MKNLLLRGTGLLLAIALLFSLSGCKSQDYKAAMELYESGEYAEAADAFSSLGDYKDSADMVPECDYQQAVAQYENGDYESAREAFQTMDGYKDSNQYIQQCTDALYSEWVVGSWKANIDLNDTTLSSLLNDSSILKSVAESDLFQKCDFHFTVTYILTFTDDGKFTAAIDEETYDNIKSELIAGLENLTPDSLKSLFSLFSSVVSSSDDSTSDQSETSSLLENVLGLLGVFDKTGVSEFVVKTVMPMIQNYLTSFIACDGSYIVENSSLTLKDSSDSSSFKLTMDENTLTLEDALSNNIKCLSWMDSFPQVFARQG